MFVVAKSIQEIREEADIDVFFIIIAKVKTGNT